MKAEGRKMKNSEHFGELTSRMNHFREEVLDKKPYICAKRALLATEAYKEHLNEPPIMKRAYMLKNILEKMPIYIEEDTLIVGNQASSNRDAPIFPEYTMEFVMNELDLFEKRDGDIFYIEPVFYTMLSSFKEHHPQKIDDILKEMDRVVKVNHKVVFTGNYDHPLTINIDDYVVLEIFDITNKLEIFVEDKSRGSDYGD